MVVQVQMESSISVHALTVCHVSMSLVTVFCMSLQTVSKHQRMAVQVQRDNCRYTFAVVMSLMTVFAVQVQRENSMYLLLVCHESHGSVFTL